MITLGIETSCDETAVALIETDHGNYRVLAETIFSQVDIHALYGGVFPVIAKREHSRRLAPLLAHIIKESGINVEIVNQDDEDGIKTGGFKNKIEIIRRILSEKEPELLTALMSSSLTRERPAIDRIAVTKGPGLEPALWVGINFAMALSVLWDIPVVPTNHMEGHIVGSLLSTIPAHTARTPQPIPLIKPHFPALALLISGGHTELVEVESLGQYSVIGSTRDDAVGEAYDKVARMLNLPYPGGPQIARLADIARKRYASAKSGINPIVFPRPMLHSPDLHFSFSGLKTSVLYYIEKIKSGGKENLAHSENLTSETTENIALAFEDAVTEVLIIKTAKALEIVEAHALIVGGGVIANTHIRNALESLARERDIVALFPPPGISGDNAVMIALAGSLSTVAPITPEQIKLSTSTIIAEGNMVL